MTTESYDDVVLEVAEELELTAIGGDFVNIILRQSNRPWNTPLALAGWGDWGHYVERSESGEAQAALGKEVTMTLDLRVDTVLAGRKVNPEDVVSLFKPPPGDTRTVQLVERPFFGPCFRLSQKQIVTIGYLEALRELLKNLAAKQDGMISAIEEAVRKIGDNQNG